MSATPIPRTLEMAVTGIREMSTLATPPEERHPVLTFVGAVRGEADRRGDPARAAARGPGLLRAQQGRVDRAGGRAAARAGARGPDRHRPREDGRAPARAGHRRLLGEARSTCSSARRSSRPGWTSPTPTRSIARARRPARACPSCTSCAGGSAAAASAPTPTSCTRRSSPLTETAHDRLATIAQHTDLGAGMQVAMKDLEIRGAGNLLGGEQSGHIAGVGLRPLRPARRRGRRGVPRRRRAEEPSR